jgi:hypothetical protein
MTDGKNTIAAATAHVIAGIRKADYRRCPLLGKASPYTLAPDYWLNGDVDHCRQS